METFDILKSLCDSVCIGNINTLPLPTEAEKLKNGSFSITLPGESDYTIAVEAHIDEVGLVVTEVKKDGFLKVSSVGGLDLRTLPSHRVLIHGKQDVFGVFTSIPPHLTKGEPEFDDINALSVDSLLGERAKEIISVGDYISFYSPLTRLAGTRVTGKSLDDRAGVCVLIKLLSMLKGEKLPVSVKLLFCSEEELGMRGAKTAAFGASADEAIALDVSFAEAPGISPEESGKLSEGPMLGVSPILSRKIYEKQKKLATDRAIPYQTEVMGGRTGTDADVISVSESGIPTGLVSIPERNMHTAAEIVDTEDIDRAAELIFRYILSGGIK